MDTTATSKRHREGDAADRHADTDHADFEIRATWSAEHVRHSRKAIVQTATQGDVDRSDELSEAQPGRPEGKRWRLRAWLRDRTDS